MVGTSPQNNFRSWEGWAKDGKVGVGHELVGEGGKREADGREQSFRARRWFDAAGRQVKRIALVTTEFGTKFCLQNGPATRFFKEYKRVWHRSSAYATNSAYKTV